MAKKVQVSDMGYLGRDAQIKIVKGLLEDPKTFRKVYPVLDANCFSEAGLRTIVGLIMDQYKKSGLVPTYGTLELLINAKTIGDETEKEELMAYLDAVRDIDTYDLDTAVDIALAFLKQQKAIGIANKIIEAVSKGYKGTTMMTYAKQLEQVETGEEKAIIYNPFEETAMHQTLHEEKEIRVPTGIPELDTCLNGGIAKGSFGMIQANAGCGKTTLATILANNAAESGFKVAQMFFEDRVEDTSRKHYARVGGGQINNYIQPVDIEGTINEIKGHCNIEAMRENLMCVKMPTGAMTVEDIELVLRELINGHNFTPDLVIIDYFDCLKLSRNPIKDKNEAEASCCRKLENFAAENNVGLWVMQQGNRSGEETTGGSTIQGAYTKLQIAHVYITISRIDGQQEQNLATLSFRKNRLGSIGKFENVYFNNGTMEIDCSSKIRTDEDLEYSDI